MVRNIALVILWFTLLHNKPADDEEQSWVRINQLGYTPAGTKVAVWCSKSDLAISTFELRNAENDQVVLKAAPGKAFGRYGPFNQTQRLDFSIYNKPGRYYLFAGGARSPVFPINASVYKGSADFCLQYMRQQRTGFNPYLNDSCHTRDGYTLYGAAAGLPDSTHVDVVGGWHDASDYLQYSTTSANATWHMLAAYRDFKEVFADQCQANGLPGKNGLADILDEARWGLDWLLKMFPSENIMFNQIGDDRDHYRMRMPGEDSVYGKGIERPVYYINGMPQQRGKFMNHTTGTSSTAGKFASAFALAHEIGIRDSSPAGKSLRDIYYAKALEAFRYGQKKEGVTQTVSVRSPYIYAEENWVDDMELAAASIAKMSGVQIPLSKKSFVDNAYGYAEKEKVTPWLGGDTAAHYQWYPFVNAGHYELAHLLSGSRRDSIITWYRNGIDAVNNKAKANAFNRGVPFIWCSNNLTTSFVLQCYWYRLLTGDGRFTMLEQAGFDWLFGCNPWGTSMVYGLPATGDTPVDPHSAFTHIKKFQINGGLVDGPVYTTIYSSLIGIALNDPDEYASFQGGLAVYHDDYGDYSTNEPTMDGTAALIYLLAAKESESLKKK